MPPKLHVPLAECGPHLGLVRGSLRPPDSKTANRLAHSFCGAHDCDQQTHAETTLHLRQQTARVSHAMRPKIEPSAFSEILTQFRGFELGAEIEFLTHSIYAGQYKAQCVVWTDELTGGIFDRVTMRRTIRYDTIRDAILTCDRKPTWVRLIYRTETTTEKWKTEKLKSKNGYA